MSSKYPGTCAACGERFPAGESIDWTKGVGARHATMNQCAEAKKAKAVAEAAKSVVVTLDLKPIADFLYAAQSRGLKKPKLRILAPDGRTEMVLAITTGGKMPGSISVVSGRNFVGCVRPNGEVTYDLRTQVVVQKHLLAVAVNPVNAAKEYAALMCRCSFCGLALTDAGSVEVGYGPICAQHWGLPHKPKGTPHLHVVVGQDVLPLSSRRS